MAAGMMNLPLAPADITPEKFFTQWLPQQLQSLGSLIAALAGDVKAGIATRVIGAGDWTAILEGGKIRIEAGLAPDALVTFILPEKNFIEAVTGQRQDMMGKPPAGAGTPEQMAAQAKQNLQALREINGAIKFVVEDEKMPFEATVKFGGELQSDPDCTITVGLDTARSMAAGETNPQAAFMSGQIKIEGDMTMVMQLMPLMQM
jgi:hypothetical protein